MENASKALIIAGAILISIVLVSVGVLVVQSLDPSSAIDDMDAQAIQMFNSKYITNSGPNKQGSIVRTLLSDVSTNNTQNEGDDGKIIKVTTENFVNSAANQTEVTDPNELATIRNAVNGSSRYDISYTIKKNGLVDVITITRKQ